MHRQRHRGRLEREFVIDNLLVRIYFIIMMIRWTGLAPWEFEFSFAGSLTSTLLKQASLCIENGSEGAYARDLRAVHFQVSTGVTLLGIQPRVG